MAETKRQRYIRELTRATMNNGPDKMIHISVKAAKEIRDLLEEREQKYVPSVSGWRCWTSRPTPEQMRDTKWEAADNGTV